MRVLIVLAVQRQVWLDATKAGNDATVSIQQQQEPVKGDGISSVAIPAQSPNCNSHAERFIKSIRHECLDHFIVFGETHLRHLVREYVAHYNAERYHQGIGGKLLTGNAVAANDNSTTAIVKARSRLAGTLNFYHREVA